jgi:hypothetical protein
MNTEERNELAEDGGGMGYLIVHVTTARGAIPLEGARVSVRRSDPTTNAPKGDVIASQASGRDGNTPALALPAPPRANSQHPGNQKPYEPYHIEISLEGFFKQSYANVPIFDGIAAVQPADLIPLPENGRTDSRTPDGERFFESTAPDL